MKKTQKLLRSFVMELVLYSALVTGYFLLALRFLGPSLKSLYDTNRPLYAGVALLLMIGQGILLEMLTTRLLILVRARTE